MLVIDQFVANLRNEDINPRKYHLDVFIALPLLVVGTIVYILSPHEDLSAGKEMISILLIMSVFVIPSVFAWAYRSMILWNFLTLTNRLGLKPVDEDKVMYNLGLKPADYLIYTESNLFWNLYDTAKENLKIFWNMFILLNQEAKTLIEKRKFLNVLWFMLLGFVLLFWIESYVNVFWGVIITSVYVVLLFQSLLDMSDAKVASVILITSIMDEVQTDEAQADEAQADEAQMDEAQADEAQMDEAQADEEENLNRNGEN